MVVHLSHALKIPKKKTREEEGLGTMKASNYNRIQKSYEVICTSLIIIWSSLAYGQTDPRNANAIRVSPEDLRGSYITKDLTSQNLRLTINKVMNNKGLHKKIRLIQENKPSLVAREKFTESHFYRFAINNDEFCNFYVRARTSLYQSPLMIGKIPNLENISIPDEVTFPDLRESILDLKLKVANGLIPFIFTHKDSSFLQTDQKSCLDFENGSITGVWKIFFRINEQPFVASYNKSGLMRVDKRFFHAQGQVYTYPKNKMETPETAAFPVELSDNSEYLENKYFTTNLNTSIYPKAQSANGIFNIEASDPRFEEAAVFINANRMIGWYQGMGYTDEQFGSPTRMILNIHATTDGSSNNAYYWPADSRNPPAIFIGDGDGKFLQNLATDIDVISHEFGHHVIWQRIQETSGESLVLHEGLADFFTFAKTGDPCLGESICPSNTNVCSWNQCLRSAENNYQMGDPEISGEAHVHSQFVSGMLWDMIAIDGIPSSDLTRLLLAGIDDLVYNSGYYDLIAVMIYADYEMYAGKYCSKILERANTRGLQDVIADNSCSELPIMPDSDRNSLSRSSTGSTTVKNSRSGTSPSLCGTINSSNDISNTILLIILIFPLGVLLIPRVIKEINLFKY